jgi:hypothetical protein
MYFRFFLKIGSDVIFVKVTSRLFRTSTPSTEGGGGGGGLVSATGTVFTSAILYPHFIYNSYSVMFAMLL